MQNKITFGLLLIALGGCAKSAPEEDTKPVAPKPVAPKVAEKPSEAPPPVTPPPAPPPPPVRKFDASQVVQKGGSDPAKGKFTLAEATAGVKGHGALIATIDTEAGPLACKMFEDKAPITVANFVGLARGVRPWKDPATGDWVKAPAYDGLTFHRIIKGFMIQGGDPLGNGTGEPGYVIPDEIWTDAKHDRAGLLCMANRGPNTNGAQFFITDAPAANLDGKYTIFGECSPVDTIHTLASTPTRGDRPVNKPAISKVTVAREKP